MEFKQVIIVRADLGMGKGKAAAQASHASLEAYKKAKSQKPDWVGEWEQQGTQKVVLKVDSEEELLQVFEAARAKKLPAALVQDAGRTQVEPGSKTCVGIGPAPESELDRITGKLKLF